MRKQKKRELIKSIYYILLILGLIGIPLFEFFAFNSMVSLKYETKELTDCISLVSGIDLCRTIKVFHLLAITSGLTFIGLLIFKKRILKDLKD
jgi:hypothetical protein